MKPILAATMILCVLPAAAQALNVRFIFFGAGPSFEDGVLEYGIDIAMIGIDDPTATVTVTPPGRLPQPMEWDPEDLDFVLVRAFPDQASLEVAFPAGDYDFTVTTTGDSLTCQNVPHAYRTLTSSSTLSPGFPEITITPEFPLGTTSPTPTFCWTLCQDCADADILDFDMDDLDVPPDQETVFGNVRFTPAMRAPTGCVSLPDFSGDPHAPDGAPLLPIDPLIDGHMYALFATVENMDAANHPCAGDDDGSLARFSEYQHKITLKFPVPEPSPGWCAAAALSAIGALRRAGLRGRNLGQSQ